VLYPLVAEWTQCVGCKAVVFLEYTIRYLCG